MCWMPGTQIVNVVFCIIFPLQTDDIASKSKGSNALWESSFNHWFAGFHHSPLPNCHQATLFFFFSKMYFCTFLSGFFFQWYSILVGSKKDHPSTKERIHDGFLIKKHVEASLKFCVSSCTCRISVAYWEHVRFLDFLSSLSCIFIFTESNRIDAPRPSELLCSWKLVSTAFCLHCSRPNYLYSSP